jgi:hypothetical protein
MEPIKRKRGGLLCLFFSYGKQHFELFCLCGMEGAAEQEYGVNLNKNQ